MKRSIKMNRLSIFLLAFAMSAQSYAGFNGLTVHSRANCANNESITWDYLKIHKLHTASEHYFPDNGVSGKGHRVHTIDTGWEDTWRSAAVHWGEGTGKWWVYGNHYIKEGRHAARLIKTTFAQDCAIYDGWWDK